MLNENEWLEVCLYPQFVDWSVKVTLGQLTPPRKNLGLYRKGYLKRWGYVHCMCHLIKHGITEGRNKRNYQGLTQARKDKVDAVCAAGIVANAFNVGTDTVLKYFRQAIRGELRPYFWGPKIPDFEVILDDLEERSKMYYKRARKK